MEEDPKLYVVLEIYVGVHGHLRLLHMTMKEVDRGVMLE